MQTKIIALDNAQSVAQDIKTICQDFLRNGENAGSQPGQALFSALGITFMLADQKNFISLLGNVQPDLDAVAARMIEADFPMLIKKDDAGNLYDLCRALSSLLEFKFGTIGFQRTALNNLLEKMLKRLFDFMDKDTPADVFLQIARIADVHFVKLTGRASELLSEKIAELKKAQAAERSYDSVGADDY